MTSKNLKNLKAGKSSVALPTGNGGRGTSIDGISIALPIRSLEGISIALPIRSLDPINVLNS